MGWIFTSSCALVSFAAVVLLMDVCYFPAILVNCSEELMELEISELKAFLQHLPSMDMDEVSDCPSAAITECNLCLQIITQAYNIRDEIKSVIE